MATTRTWGRVQRPWGYEIRVDITDGDGNIRSEVMNFDSEPDDETLASKVAELYGESLLSQGSISQPVDMGVDAIEQRICECCGQVII